MLEINLGLKYIIFDYCYVGYLDGKYKKKSIKVRYV